MQYSEFEELKLMFLVSGNRFVSESEITQRLGKDSQKLLKKLGIKVEVVPPGPRGGGDMGLYDYLAMAKSLKILITLLLPIIKATIQFIRNRHATIRLKRQPKVHILLSAEYKDGVTNIYSVQGATGTYLTELNDIGAYLANELEKSHPLFKFTLRSSVSYVAIRYRASLFFDSNQLQNFKIGRMYRTLEKIPVRPFTQHEYFFKNIFICRRDSVVSNHGEDVLMTGWSLSSWKHYYFAVSRLTLRDILKNMKTRKEYVEYLREVNNY